MIIRVHRKLGYGFRKHNILYLPNDGGGWKRVFPFQWDESQVPVISFGVKSCTSWYKSAI